MPKILVNFKRNKDGSYKLYDTEKVFADMPIAQMEMDTDYTNPIVVNIKDIATVVEKEEYEKTNKLFKLKLDENGNLIEDEENGIEIYLPKETDINSLKYINGEIVKVENEKID